MPKWYNAYHFTEIRDTLLHIQEDPPHSGTDVKYLSAFRAVILNRTFFGNRMPIIRQKTRTASIDSMRKLG